MRGIFKLEPHPISQDTVLALEEMLADARAGRIVGLVIAAMYVEREYVVGATGEAFRSPTFARGMVAAIDDQLSRMISGDA